MPYARPEKDTEERWREIREDGLRNQAGKDEYDLMTTGWIRAESPSPVSRRRWTVPRYAVSSRGGIAHAPAQERAIKEESKQDISGEEER